MLGKGGTGKEEWLHFCLKCIDKAMPPPYLSSLKSVYSLSIFVHNQSISSNPSFGFEFRLGLELVKEVESQQNVSIKAGKLSQEIPRIFFPTSGVIK